MKKRRLRDSRIYVIIDQKTASGKDLVLIAKESIAGGTDIVQLRVEPQALTKDILNTAISIKNIADKAGCIFIVNNRVDIARSIMADGVHLGQEDLLIESARAILGPEAIIGVSTHSLKQAMDAAAGGASYISVGPIFATPTKPEYAPVGLELLKEVKRKVTIPIFAIGGIDSRNIKEAVKAGASGIAIVRAVVAAEDIKQAVRNLCLSFRTQAALCANGSRTL